ncbi:MAG TPA: phage holin family protein [Parcubacteria group bacterium]|nr:phage holin family protein [Parcubacteria group bacterium]
MKILIHLLLSALAIFVTAYLLPGVDVDTWATYFILAVVLGAINIFIKPILTLLTLPLSIITLGLFSIVLNALMVMLADKIVPGFSVDGFVSALLFGLVLGVVSFVFKKFD